MKLAKPILSIILALHACAAVAGDHNAPLRERIIGAWQAGLTAKVRAMPDETMRSLFLGHLIAFDPDGAFHLYPRCGRETDALKKRGLDSYPGKWHVDASGALHVITAHEGKPNDHILPISFEGDELVIVDRSPTSPTTFGRYAGPRPFDCGKK